MGVNRLRNIKFIALTTILILSLIVIPTCFAMDNETAFAVSDEDALSSVDDDVLDADYYFDANVENDDGNGLIYNPYKKLTTNRIKDNSVIHLASGEYSLNGKRTVNNVTIIGESATNTLVDNVMFTVSKSLTLYNVTFTGSSITNNGKFIAYNSIFKDSYSKLYGGVINSNQGEITLINCTFSNNVALSGGAIFAKYGSLNIEDSLFINNYAEIFGGAITSIGTTLNMNNVISRNNKADVDGGVVYSFDDTSVRVINSNFVNNSANNGGALFIDASGYNIIKDNSFVNNTSKSLYLFYNLNSTVENNNYSSYDDFFETMEINMFIGSNNYTLYNYYPTEITEFPSRYDLRELGYVTSVKSQGSNGNCWAFATLATLESCILKAAGDNLDLSESNLKNLFGSFSDYGWIYETNRGALASMGYNYLISWLGPILESEDNYILDSLFSKVLNSLMHVQNVLFIQRNNFTDNDEIKRALMTYGAVYSSIYASFDNDGKQYYSGSNNPNHAIVIVGWDDTLEFNNAPGKGGWIIKNSWGAGWKEHGYGYVSYYDTTCAPIGKMDSVFTFILNDTIRFDKNYQYDLQGKSDFFLNSSSTVWYKNIFNATEDEYLAAVSTIFDKNTNYTFSIYVNNQLKLTQSGFSKPGYFTFNLNEIIPLRAGDTFEIVFNITVDGEAGVPISEKVSFIKYYYKENTSFLSYDGQNWVDFYELAWKYSTHTYNSQVACIKAFTVLNPITTSVDVKIENIRSNSLDLAATVYNEWGHVVNRGNVIFNVSGKELIVPIQEGIARLLNVSITEGINNYTASFSRIGHVNSNDYALFSKDLIITFTVLNNLSKHNVVTIVANVSDINGNPVNYGNVIFNIDSKNYTVDISNGIASFNHTFTNLGLNNVTAYYDGYDCYNSSNNSILINVSLINTSISLNVSNEYNPINITANVIDEYGKRVNRGIVVFRIEGKDYTVNVNDGQACLNHIFDKKGLNNISATFKDDGYIYNSSANSTSVNISLINTTLEVIIENQTNPVEITVLIKDQFNNPVPSGVVTFNIENKTQMVSVNDGIAKFSYIFSEVGYKTISVCFNDFSYRYDSSNKDTNLNVSKTKVNMSLNINDNHEFSIEFSQPINEYVYLLIDETLYRQKTTDGKCTFTFDKFISRNHSVRAFLKSYVYECDDVFDEFYFYYDTNLTVSVNEFYYGDYFSVVLKDVTNNLPVKNKEIQFIINNQIFKNRTDDKGVTVIVLPFIGNYEINILFNEDEDYHGTSLLSTVEILSSIISSDATRTLNSQYAIKMLDKKGNPLNDTEIDLEIASKVYKLTTDENGTAILNIDLNPGNYGIKIINPANGEVKTQNLKVSARIGGNKDLTMYYSAGKYYTVRVFDDEGNVAKNVQVTFTLNKKQYIKTTDANGYASIKISLSPAKYTITAEYKGFKVSNKITVKSTIITKNIKVKKGKTIKFTAKLVNKNGKILKNKKITFKFKGKTYHVKTNKKGKATLKIHKKYRKGKYTITSRYGKLKIKNTIKIVK